MLRRTFLASAGLATAAGVSAAPLKPSGVKLGIDAYSIRAWNQKAPDLLEYAIAQKVDVLQFSNLHEFESLEPAYLGKLKDRAAAAKMDLEVGLGSICRTSAGFGKQWATGEEYLTTALKTARALGAGVIKTYLGSSADRAGALPLEKHIEDTLRVLKTVRPMATDFGVRIAIENHSGDLLAHELRDLIETAGKDFVGACVDTGNPMMTLEDPVRVLEVLGPYAATTHIRDAVLFEHPRGAAWQWVALGDGVIDWQRFMDVYVRVCPKAAFLLENITGRPPRVVPFLEQDFWKPFSNVRASEFAAYVALARRGSPLMDNMVIADVGGQQPPEYREALKLQQRRDLEKGLNYAKQQLGVGVNCR